MKLRIILGVGAMTSLAACGPGPDPDAQKEKFLVSKNEALNVEFSDSGMAERVVGFRAASVTTVINGNADPRSGTEPSSVKSDCRLTSRGYAASFRTPATVNLPSFGRDTPPVTLSCTYNDEDVTKSFKAENLSKSSRTGTALGVGVLLCPVCGVAAGIAGSNDKVGDAYGFSALQLVVD